MYEQEALACRRDGVSADDADRSAHLIKTVELRSAYLDESAYHPTGLALGVPLPSPAFEQQLFSLATLIDSELAKATGTEAPCIALVPSSAYHVTVLNRSHFEAGGATSRVTEDNVRMLAEEIRELLAGPIIVRFEGLLLTGSGRLMARGFPVGEELFDIRTTLVERFPLLRCRIPPAAHIKLGHLVVPVDREAIGGVLESIANLGSQVDMTLRFDSLYSPAGRIPIPVAEES